MSDRINYSIRTNKNIERKLVFDLLKAVDPVFGFRDYRYIGFGSMWFVDFILAHRFLGISDMWSLEQSAFDRAEFNKPFQCIRVLEGYSTPLIEGMLDSDWQKRAVAWLDYTGRFDDDVVQDCRRFLSRAAVGSVLIVTVNASRRSYVAKAPGGVSISSVETLRRLLGDSVGDPGLSGERQDVGELEFPGLLSKSLVNFMTSVVRSSGRSSEDLPDRFVPLFEMHHEDQARMTTVGGIVTSWRHVAPLEAALKSSATELYAGNARLRQTLDLKPITMKEKIVLDRLLPENLDQFVAAALAAGIKLSADQIEKYRPLYSHFPMFAETQP